MPIDQMLRDHPFLRGLEPKHIQALAGSACHRSYATGEHLWRQGEEADALYLICAGQVALEIYIPHQGPLHVDTTEAGEALGWSWLVPPYQWKFDARALTPVLTLSLDGEGLRRLAEKDHGLGYQLLKRFVPVIGRRLDVTRMRLLELHGITGIKGVPADNRPPAAGRYSADS